MATKKKTSKTASKKKTSAKAAPSAGSKKTSAAKKKSAAGKSTAKKKPAAKKKATAKKTGTKKKTAASKTGAKKKAAAGKTVAKKSAKKKTSAPSSTSATVPLPRGRKPAPRKSARQAGLDEETPVKPKVKPMNKRDLKKFKKILLELRDRLQGDIRFLTTDNLHRAGRETGADLSGAAQHSADHGTDNFDREFALSLASAEEDVMYEVDEALMRIQEGTYGICELTGVRIEPARLEVIPYTRYSVQAQAKMEQSRAGYRPFGQSFKKW